MSIFKTESGYFTNADAVAAWVERVEEDGVVSDIVLPDYKQTYHFDGLSETEGGTRLFLFRAPCRVCGTMFTTDTSINQFKAGVGLRRNCSEHKYQSRTERGAWMRGAELASLIEARDQPKPHRVHVGRAQEDVLLALEELEDLFSPVPIDLLLKQAAMKAWRGKGKKDQRVKTARTALRGLLRRGLVDRARLAGQLA